MASRAPTHPSGRALRRHGMLLDLSRVFEDLEEEGQLTSLTDGSGELHVDELLAAAGIARSTFYVYFEDRSDLLTALTKIVFAAFVEAAKFWWALPAPVTRPDVREAMERVADAYRSHRGAVSLATGTAAQGTRSREEFLRIVDGVVAEFVTGIEAGQASGAIDDTIDPTATAIWLVWMLERGLSRLVLPADGETTDRLLQGLTDLVWNVLYRSAGGPR